MFDSDSMEYRISEDRFDDLCNARHLLNTLSELTTTGTSEPRVDLNRESLAITFSVIGEMMDKAIPDLCPDRINRHAISKESEGSQHE